MPPDGRDHARLSAAFRWNLPARFSIAEAICDRWAATEPDRPALLLKRPGAALAPVSYGEIRAASQALAAALHRRGLRRGDPAARLRPQGA
ncbi:AMP-dependent synthetase, partial [Methylopila musalis]